MGVFGDLDMSEVPEDPFFVPEDNYWAECTEAVVKESKKDGSPNVALKWSIDEPNSQYHNMPLTEWYPLPEEGVSYEDLPPKMKQRMAFFKKRLRGAFDLSEHQINQLEDWDELVGSRAYLSVTNTSVGDTTYSNVGNAISERQWKEEMADSADDTDAAESDANPFAGL